MLRSAVFVAVLAATPAISSAQQPCTTDARHVVNELYRHILERSADPGSQGWVDKLQGGMTVSDLRCRDDKRFVATLGPESLLLSPRGSGPRAVIAAAFTWYCEAR